MKRITGMRRAAAAGFAACALLLAGCSDAADDGGSTSSPSPSGGQEAYLSFVAADKTNWDKEVTIGDYVYTLAVNFDEGGTLTLDATCTGRAEAETGGMGGPGGGFGGGFGGPGGQQEEETEPEESLPPLTEEEMDALDFSKSGSWTLEEGYGYTVTIDGYTTKTNYDTASARHIFYAELTNDGASSGLVQFQGKDTAFRQTLAADYEDFELREAAYFFENVDKSTNNNPNSTRLYLEEDGSANSLTYRGSSPTYTRGTWTENADKSITVSIGGSDYTADYCDVAGKEGYRVTYNSATMYASVSGEEIAYTDVDFNGETIMSLTCAEGDFTLDLTEKGYAIVMKDGAASVNGRYTEEGGVYTVTLGGNQFTSQDGSITVDFEVASQNRGPWGGTESYTRTFALAG